MRRRHALRFVLALVATTLRAACADLSTGPAAPNGPRLDEGYNSGVTDTASARASNHQGTSI